MRCQERLLQTSTNSLFIVDCFVLGGEQRRKVAAAAAAKKGTAASKDPTLMV